MENISSEQREQLIEWLAEHTYSEVRDLIAAPVPDGFGIETSIATVCRFYKANFSKVGILRQQKLNDRGADQRQYADTLNDFYRENLAHGATISLQERFYELLSRPVESIDELKKLVYICKQIKDLEIELCPVKVTKESLLAELDACIDRLTKKYDARKTTGLPPEASSASETDAAPPPADNSITPVQTSGEDPIRSAA